MNVIFILMFGDRAPEVKDSVMVIKRVMEVILNKIGKNKSEEESGLNHLI